MKKGWRVFIKIIDVIVWLWGKIKPSLPKEDSNSINNQSK